MRETSPRVVLFDFDGTLVESAGVIVDALRVALDHAGVAHEHLDSAALGGHVGVPLPVLFPKLGVSADRLRGTVTAFQRHFAEHGAAGTLPYLGVEAMLERVAAAGATLGIATAKPASVARKVVAHLGWTERFAVLAGANDDESGGAKDEVIDKALAGFGDAGVSVDASTAVMVGDRASDIAGAKRHGLTAVGVLWGYGSREELEGAAPAALAGSVDELCDLLLRGVGVP